MNKLWTFGLIILIIIVVLSFYINGLNDSNNITEIEEIREDVKKIEDGTPLIEEKDEQIEVGLSECEKIEGDSEKNYCIHDIAVVNENLTLCEKVEQIDFISEEGCLIAIAYQTKSLDICTKIEQLVGRGYLCFGRIAVLEKDPEICNEIVKQAYKDLCLKDVGAI